MTIAALKRAEASLREYALSFPGAEEAFPWGHLAVKVRGKAFLFMSRDAKGLSLSTKLPSSREVALALPFASPTGYGLGKSGWVSAAFGPGDRVPLPVLRLWIEESYGAMTPPPKRPRRR